MMAEALKKVVLGDPAEDLAVRPELDPTWDTGTARGVLCLSDLLTDKNGQVVLHNDSGLRSMILLTDAKLLDEGKSGRHVTAAGDNVTGFHFMSFDNGMTLFFEPQLELVIEPATAD